MHAYTAHSCRNAEDILSKIKEDKIQMTGTIAISIPNEGQFRNISTTPAPSNRAHVHRCRCFRKNHTSCVRSKHFHPQNSLYLRICHPLVIFLRSLYKETFRFQFDLVAVLLDLVSLARVWRCGSWICPISMEMDSLSIFSL